MSTVAEPSGAMTVVSRLPSQGLGCWPGLQSQTVPSAASAAVGASRQADNVTAAANASIAGANLLEPHPDPIAPEATRQVLSPASRPFLCDDRRPSRVDIV